MLNGLSGDGRAVYFIQFTGIDEGVCQFEVNEGSIGMILYGKPDPEGRLAEPHIGRFLLTLLKTFGVYDLINTKIVTFVLIDFQVFAN